ncbi:P-loop containing nucleoside triphosphate hydrolase protein [Xylariomycetidae sp. FL2044]|nr:P-loop containing nucleoside triphosphate hydrolase protein [Xylariomycetidae sp. FL2044]
MDYQSLHGQDVASFDLSSTHRLPTVSAAQALEDLGSDPGRFIPTSLDALDRALNDAPGGGSEGSQRPGGLQKGQVVEVWGPPGSGKSAFGIQLAANVLRSGQNAVWVDGFHPVCGLRLREAISSAPKQSSQNESATADLDLGNDMLHFTTPTLAHLIALLCKPTAASIPDNTSLIVIDTLSSLVNQAYPRNPEAKQTMKGTDSRNALYFHPRSNFTNLSPSIVPGPGPGPLVRRFQVLQFVMSALQKLAATRDLVIVILSQCATRMQAERGATLIPAINAGTWEQGVATRLVLFRDWILDSDMTHDAHLVGIQKQNGKVMPDGIGPVFPFDIKTAGLASIDLNGSQPSVTLSSTPYRKRKLNQTDFEIADSEGEDYGWDDEDEGAMPKMPPQWQGSEDILLGQPEEDDNRSDDDPEAESLTRKEGSPGLEHPEDAHDSGDEPA